MMISRKKQTMFLSLLLMTSMCIIASPDEDEEDADDIAIELVDPSAEQIKKQNALAQEIQEAKKRHAAVLDAVQKGYNEAWDQAQQTITTIPTRPMLNSLTKVNLQRIAQRQMPTNISDIAAHEAQFKQCLMEGKKSAPACGRMFGAQKALVDCLLLSYAKQELSTQEKSLENDISLQGRAQRKEIAKIKQALQENENEIKKENATVASLAALAVLEMVTHEKALFKALDAAQS